MDFNAKENIITTIASGMFSAANDFSIAVEKLAKEESSLQATVVETESGLLRAKQPARKSYASGISTS